MPFVADVFDAVLISNVDGSVIASTTLTTGNINIDVQESEIRGGKGNALQGILHSQRDIAVEMEDTNFRYDWLSKQLGQNIVTGAGVGYAMPTWYTAVEATGVKVTVSPAPKATGHAMKIYKADGTEVTTFTVSGSTVTFTSGVVAGDKVEVRTYKYDTSAQTQTLSIDQKTFAKGVTLVLETLEIDENEVPKFKVQYQFDNALPNGSFSVSTSSDRSASAQNMSLRIVKPSTSDTVGRVLRIPV